MVHHYNALQRKRTARVIYANADSQPVATASETGETMAVMANIVAVNDIQHFLVNLQVHAAC